MRRPLLPLVLAAAALAACDDAASGASPGDVARLRADLERSEAERSRLASRVDALDRRIAGLQADLMTSRREAADAPSRPETPAAGEASSGGAAPAAPPSLETRGAARELEQVLATEEGRRVFDAAVRAFEARQREERQSQMVAGMVDAFAARASLTPQQAESLRGILGKAFTEIANVRRTMREQDTAPEDRQARMAELREKTDELRRRADEEVRGVLDSRQFEMYQQDSRRLRGFDGGGPGGFGGFGGRGGGGGE